MTQCLKNHNGISNFQMTTKIKKATEQWKQCVCVCVYFNVVIVIVNEVDDIMSKERDRKRDNKYM